MKLRELITRVIKDQQPFCVAHYSTGLKFSNDRVSSVYELLLWQTWSFSDENLDYRMEMTKEDFDDIRKEFGLRVVQRNEHGTIYGINNTLGTLAAQYEKLRIALLNTRAEFYDPMKALKDRLHNDVSLSVYAEPLLRQASNMMMVIEEIESHAKQDFEKAHGIKIYNLRSLRQDEYTTE